MIHASSQSKVASRYILKFDRQATLELLTIFFSVILLVQQEWLGGAAETGSAD
jgi:hypothetical protein